MDHDQPGSVPDTPEAVLAQSLEDSAHDWTLRDWASFLWAVFAHEYARPPCPGRTAAMPGTPGKILVMRRRYTMGQHLYHPTLDARPGETSTALDAPVDNVAFEQIARRGRHDTHAAGQTVELGPGGVLLDESGRPVRVGEHDQFWRLRLLDDRWAETAAPRRRLALKRLKKLLRIRGRLPAGAVFGRAAEVFIDQLDGEEDIGGPLALRFSPAGGGLLPHAATGTGDAGPGHEGPGL